MVLKDTKPDGPPVQHDGFIDGVMSKVFGRSWKTSVSGIIVFVCGIVPYVPGLHPLVQDICRALLPAVTGAGLILAKDKNVSGQKK